MQLKISVADHLWVKFKWHLIKANPTYGNVKDLL